MKNVIFEWSPALSFGTHPVRGFEVQRRDVICPPVFVDKKTPLFRQDQHKHIKKEPSIIPTSTWLPLASNQREVWCDQIAYPDSAIYNIGGYLCIDGHVEYGLLKKAAYQLVESNDTLRLNFKEQGSQVFQKVEKTVAAEVDYLDFSKQKNARKAAQKWLDDVFTKPFSLQQPMKLWHFALVKESDNCHYLMTKYHHIIADGWTSILVFNQLAQLYTAILEGKSLKIESQKSYIDHVQQESDYFKSNAYKKDEVYWKQTLSSLPEPIIENRKPVASKNLPSASVHRFKLKRHFYNQIIKFARENEVTTYHVLLSALVLYFSRITNVNDVVIGVPNLNRGGARYKNVLGMFVSLSPLRLQVDCSETIVLFMKHCGQALKRNYRHQRYPLSAIHKQLDMMQHGRSSLFDLLVSYEQHECSIPFGKAPKRVVQQFSGTIRYPLAVSICEFHQDHDVEMVLEGSDNAFCPQSLEALANRIHFILEQMIEMPQQLVGNINLITQFDQYSILDKFNSQKTLIPFKASVVDLFRDKVSAYPQQTVVEDNDGETLTQLTYLQMDQLTNRLAHYLVELGAKSNKTIAICLPRCIEMSVGILAIMKSGAAYLPISPDTPEARMRVMLEQANVSLLLTVKSCLSDLTVTTPQKTIVLDELDDTLEPYPIHPVISQNSEHDLAYVIFTSGSTGLPKGVMVEHGALASRLQWMTKTFNIGAHDRIGQTVNFNFDASLIEIFLALTSGACLCFAPPRLHSHNALACFVAENKISFLALVPSSVRTLLTGLKNNNLKLIHLRSACCGGEVLSPDLATDFIQTTGAHLFNVYGPTEATILASAWHCKQDNTNAAHLPIGRPVDDTSIYIMDERQQLLPAGVKGEIYIGGSGVARGYLKDESLDQARFITDPYCNTLSGKIYKTGDVGYIDENGQLYYTGRIDRQIKISGYRIELGELESPLNAHPEVHLAAAKVIDGDQQKFIMVFIEPMNTATDNLEKELSQLLRKSLPDYMQPKMMVRINKMPMTSIGKIDYDALHKPEITPNLQKRKLPQTVLESQLMKVWEETLDVKGLSIEDNFFELGGDSFSAVTLIKKIDQLTGRRHTLTFLLDYPTIERQAEIVSCDLHLDAVPVLTSLNNNIGDRPFYLAASGHGDALRFSNLANELTDVCSLHMLQPSGDLTKQSSISELAEQYAELILIRNEPPGYIGGFSIGGITALETASVLTLRGKPPLGVLLLDTAYPRKTLTSPVLLWLLQAVSKFPLLNKIIINGRRLEVMLSDPGICTQLWALQHHEIKQYDGSVALFISNKMSSKRYLFSLWSKIFTDDIQKYFVDGLHGGIFQPPFVNKLANTISEYFATVDH